MNKIIDGLRINKLTNYNSAVKTVFKNIVLPLIIFLGLTFAYNPQLLTGFSSIIEKNDGRLIAWTLAWDNHALLTNPLDLYQGNIFYPNSNTLTYSEHLFGASLITLPFYIISNGNPVIGFNALMIICYVLNAFFTYLFVRYKTRNNYAGIIAGIIFGFCCYKVWNYGHLQNMVIFYFPLLLYFMFKYFELKKMKYLFGVGLCLLLQSLTSWYHMVFIFLMFFIFCLHFLIKKQVTKIDFRRFIVMMIVIGAILIPFALPYFTNKSTVYTINDLKTYSADFGGYLLPSPHTFIGNVILPKLNIVKVRWIENFNFLGYISIALVLIYFIRIKVKKESIDIKLLKQNLIYLVTGAIFGILSFGPFLRIGDEITKIPLPYLAIYHLISPLRFIRAVSRYSTVVFLMLAILAAFGFLLVFNRIKSRALKLLFFAIVLILIVFEHYPYQKWTDLADVSKTPEIYNEVKNNPEVKAIVQLPIDVHPFVTTDYVYYAGIHFKGLVNGYSGTEPKDYEFNKDLFTNFINDIGLVRLREMEVTHILTTPEYEGQITTSNVELVKDAEGYKLYKIKDFVMDDAVYVDNFYNEPVNYNYGNVEYLYENAQLNNPDNATPVFNISPNELNKAGTFEIKSDKIIDVARFKFRAYGKNDRVTVSCGGNDFAFKMVDFTKTYKEFECNSNSILITLFATEYRDRAMVQSLALFSE